MSSQAGKDDYTGGNTRDNYRITQRWYPVIHLKSVCYFPVFKNLKISKKMKKLLKRKEEVDTSMLIQVSVRTETLLKKISERSGIAAGDLLVICLHNVIKSGLIQPHYCKSCERENWRDEQGVFYEIFEVADRDRCAFCGSDEDWVTRDVGALLEGL